MSKKPCCGRCAWWTSSWLRKDRRRWHIDWDNSGTCAAPIPDCSDGACGYRYSMDGSDGRACSCFKAREAEEKDCTTTTPEARVGPL